MKLVYWPASILKKISLPLGEAPSQELIDGMRATMKQHGGAGISAVQVGVLQRIILVADLVLVNPVIVSKSVESAVRREGCLSVPGFFEDIHRALEITVTYKNEKFEDRGPQEFHGFAAHVIQHELEHLDGKLYLDHLTPARRSQIMGNMQALRRAGRLK